MKTAFRGALVVVVLTLLAGIAQADPLTNCVAKTTGAGFTCDVYQVLSNPMYEHSQISSVFGLPTFVEPGFLVLTSDPGTPSDTVAWSNVLQFIDNGPGTSSSLQLFSIGCNNTTDPTDQSCLPPLGVVQGALTSAFLAYDPAVSSMYVYNAGYNTYNIYTTAVAYNPPPPPIDGGGGDNNNGGSDPTNGGNTPGSNPSPVPEPGSLFLMGAGLIGLAKIAKRCMQ